MEQDIRDFLNQFSFEELLEQNILSPWSRNNLKYYRLDAQSYAPLIELMKQYGATRLEAKKHDWFLTSDGEFANPNSKEITRGMVAELSSPRHVFREGYDHINPFYYYQSVLDNLDKSQGDQSETPSDHSGMIAFGLEKDLQRALRNNIGQLEPGLTVIDGGSERIVEAGRIDITAEDGQGSLVVIELKSGTAQPESIAQLLSYMGSIDEECKPIRGMLVAHDFHPRLVMAARAVPNISLKAYSFQFYSKTVNSLPRSARKTYNTQHSLKLCRKGAKCPTS